VKRIFGSYNQPLVHHVKNMLEAAGIRVLVRNQYLSGAMGELPPAECQAELWVLDEKDYEKAAAVFQAQAVSGPDWTCRCGEVLGAQFTQCWRCGAARTPGRW
jgi:Putative prokaryotic signal transducing protein